MAFATDEYLIESSYLRLLGIEHGSKSRMGIQPALATLRDELARLLGRDPEEVQAAYEAVAVASRRLQVDPDELAAVGNRAAPKPQLDS